MSDIGYQSWDPGAQNTDFEPLLPFWSVVFSFSDTNTYQFLFYFGRPHRKVQENSWTENIASCGRWKIGSKNAPF